MAWLEKFKENVKKSGHETSLGNVGLFRDVNILYRCANDGTFLQQDTQEKDIAVCPKCGFKRNITKGVP